MTAVSVSTRVGRRLTATELVRVSSGARMPTVSVVVPCYNYAHLLADAVCSVTAQSGVHVQVIIVDDASTDESRRVAETMAATDDRVSVISHTSNQGHIATYNEGLAEAQGDYVVLLSADDMLAPSSLRRAVDLMESHPSVGFVYGRVCTFSHSRDAVQRDVSPSFKVWSGRDWLARRCRRVTNCVMSPEVVMRRNVYERIGPYQPDLPHTGDLAMWMLGAAVADVGYIDGPFAAFYRQHAGNMHVTYFHSGYVEGMLLDLEQRRRAFQVVFEKEGHDLPGAPALCGLAMQQLAAESLAAAARAYTWGLTDEWPVEDFVAFARETWPRCESLPQWRALKRRKRIGVRGSRKNPCFVFTEWRLRAEAARTRRVQEQTGA